ncbi:MAG: type II 3-dehydroquinate dehydratase [Spirochaetes bacterium]|nr:type II 3-dehydroquinate dehydratase [Spirochaetota bacterium]
MKIALLNGPNLNLLGTREPTIYGNFTLDDIYEDLKKIIKTNGKQIELFSFQSNIEGELINFIHLCPEREIDYVIFNPGAYTHTSIALMDAIQSVNCKVIEVHISNIHQRENFRQTSYIAKAAIGQISGFGFDSYRLALHYILEHEKS